VGDLGGEHSSDRGGEEATRYMEEIKCTKRSKKFISNRAEPVIEEGDVGGKRFATGDKELPMS